MSPPDVAIAPGAPSRGVVLPRPVPSGVACCSPQGCFVLLPAARVTRSADGP